MRYGYILWDWNGTLADDCPCAMQAVNDILSERGRTPITLEQYYEYVDTPIRRFYERVFDLEQEDYEALLKKYNAYYRLHMQRDGALRDGSKELLQALQSAGVQQWLVTASNQCDVVQYLKRFDIFRYFDRVLGANDYHAESKIDRIRVALRTSAVASSQILVVGDTLHDWELAQAIGAECILLEGGHQSGAQLRTAHATVYASMRELKTALEI